MTLRRKYELIERFGNRVHSWSIEGRDGAINIHVTINDNQEHRTYGGVEVHSRTALGDRPPDHHYCQYTGGHCWHDGSSLWVEENIVPYIKGYKEEFSLAVHEHMWGECKGWYTNRFITTED